MTNSVSPLGPSSGVKGAFSNKNLSFDENTGLKQVILPTVENNDLEDIRPHLSTLQLVSLKTQLVVFNILSLLTSSFTSYFAAKANEAYISLNFSHFSDEKEEPFLDIDNAYYSKVLTRLETQLDKSIFQTDLTKITFYSEIRDLIEILPEDHALKPSLRAILDGNHIDDLIALNRYAIAGNREEILIMLDENKLTRDISEEVRGALMTNDFHKVSVLALKEFKLCKKSITGAQKDLRSIPTRVESVSKDHFVSEETSCDFDALDINEGTDTFTSIPRAVQNLTSGKPLTNATTKTFIERFEKQFGHRALFSDVLMQKEEVTNRNLLTEIINLIDEAKNNNKELVVIPMIHESIQRDHNVALVVDLKNGQIDYFDPRGKLRAEKVIPALGVSVGNFLDSLIGQYGQETGQLFALNHVKGPSSSRQSLFDSKNCGVFVLKFVEARLSGMTAQEAANQVDSLFFKLDRLELARMLQTELPSKDDVKEALEEFDGVLRELDFLDRDVVEPLISGDLPMDIRIMAMRVLGQKNGQGFEDLKQAVKDKLADPALKIAASRDFSEVSNQKELDALLKKRKLPHDGLFLSMSVPMLKTVKLALADIREGGGNEQAIETRYRAIRDILKFYPRFCEETGLKTLLEEVLANIRKEELLQLHGYIIREDEAAILQLLVSHEEIEQNAFLNQLEQCFPVDEKRKPDFQKMRDLYRQEISSVLKKNSELIRKVDAVLTQHDPEFVADHVDLSEYEG